tara:strand:- start:19947 stop:20156 length:210 start_codon:yes stop_codon:yes gene_type:complete
MDRIDIGEDMIEDKLKSMKEQLEMVSEKERTLSDSLRQMQELKLKYLGAIEVLEQLEEDSKESEEKEKK